MQIVEDKEFETGFENFKNKLKTKFESTKNNTYVLTKIKPSSIGRSKTYLFPDKIPLDYRKQKLKRKIRDLQTKITQMFESSNGGVHKIKNDAKSYLGYLDRVKITGQKMTRERKINAAIWMAIEKNLDPVSRLFLFFSFQNITRDYLMIKKHLQKRGLESKECPNFLDVDNAFPVHRKIIWLEKTPMLSLVNNAADAMLESFLRSLNQSERFKKRKGIWLACFYLCSTEVSGKPGWPKLVNTLPIFCWAKYFGISRQSLSNRIKELRKYFGNDLEKGILTSYKKGILP